MLCCVPRSDPKGDNEFNAQSAIHQTGVWTMNAFVHHSAASTHTSGGDDDDDMVMMMTAVVQEQADTRRALRNERGGGKETKHTTPRTSVGERRNGFNARCHSSTSETQSVGSHHASGHHIIQTNKDTRTLARRERTNTGDNEKKRKKKTLPPTSTPRGSVQVCCVLSGGHHSARTSWKQMQ